MNAGKYDDHNHEERVEAMRKRVIEYLGWSTKKEVSHTRLTDEQLRMLSQFRVRLAGFDEVGELLGSEKLSEDLEEVQKIEAELVIDPESITAQLRAANEGGEPPFVKLGGHVNLNSIETLKEVMRHGYVILFELKGKDDEYHAVASIYGFHDSSDIPEEFPAMQIGNILVPGSADRKTIFKRPKKINSNLRTSVAEKANLGEDISLSEEKKSEVGIVDVRRLGIGSMLKMILTYLGGEFIMLNIATIRGSYKNDKEWIRGLMENKASQQYNSNFLKSTGYKRRETTKINDNSGKEVAEAEWNVYIGICDDVRKKISQLLKKKGIAPPILQRLKSQSKVIKNILKTQRNKIREMLDELDI